jgi:hypothetical protein
LKQQASRSEGKDEMRNSDIVWNSEIVEDQTKLFLSKLQSFEGFSDHEVSFGVMCAVEDWLTTLQGVERSHAIECLHELAERIHCHTHSSEIG